MVVDFGERIGLGDGDDGGVGVGVGLELEEKGSGDWDPDFLAKIAGHGVIGNGGIPIV